MDITIEKLIYGGEGWPITTGRPCLCRFVLPAESVRRCGVEQKKKFVRARVERILRTASANVSRRGVRILGSAAGAITSTFLTMRS